MTGKRALAAAFAVVLVVVAFVVRASNDDDSTEADGSTTTTSVTAVSATDAPAATSNVVCITELEAVCRQLSESMPELSVAVEPAGRTLDHLASLDDPATAPLWITVEPYPAMVDALRSGGADPIGYVADPLAASALAVAMPAAVTATVEPSADPTSASVPAASSADTSPEPTTPEASTPAASTPGESATSAAAASSPSTTAAGAAPAASRSEVLTKECVDLTLWRCIGDKAGDPWTDLGGETSWRTLRPALGDVENSAMGLLSFANAVGGYLDSADFNPGSWDSDVSFNPWVRGLARASTGTPGEGRNPLQAMAVGRAIDIGATATYELASLGANGDRFELVYPAPQMWLQAVLAVPPGAVAPDGLADYLTDGLLGAGWEASSLAAQSPPDAPTMLALRQLWKESA